MNADNNIQEYPQQVLSSDESATFLPPLMLETDAHMMTVPEAEEEAAAERCGGTAALQESMDVDGAVENISRAGEALPCQYPTDTQLQDSATSSSVPVRQKEENGGNGTEGTTVSNYPSLPVGNGVVASGAPPDDLLKDVNGGINGGEDEEDEDEDEEDELSDGEDLREDLEDALDNSNLAFTGNFYYAGILTMAPNPCLHIAGLGLVGLPLSERDAKSIVSCATLAPFGHGERTVVDQQVRDTWEIEPSRLVFGNPEWVKFIEGTICLEVCKTLGVAVGNSPPKMELYKLLLYETGSHFLPHQDTQKTNGMFATVVVLLPSAYTGGQVVVSHASTTKTIDLAPNSLLSTAVLAWYTDVRHEVKPVTSGYRLALSYNLVHVAPPGIPKPTLPQMEDCVEKLRHVLRKWRADKYDETPEVPLVAYLLDHQYSSMNLGEGLKTLKGADLHKVTFLRDVAEELGYMVGLASLEHHVCGPGEDSGGGYYQRRRHRYSYDEDEDEDDDEEDVPEMLEESDSSTDISTLVNLNGFSLLPFGKITLEEGNLIQKNPFEDAVPDDKDYEGYMGNGAGDVNYCGYRRTVLVVMHQEDVDNVCFSIAGIPYAFQKLVVLGAENSTLPTADMKIWAHRIVSKSNQLNKDQTTRMLDHALKWKDVEIFKTTMKSPACTLGVANEDLFLKAWRAFSFEVVRSCLEESLARSKELAAKINLIYKIKSQTLPEEEPVVHVWCKKESDKVLASYTQADPKDIPAIVSIIHVTGWSAFVKSMLPNLLKQPNTYTFWIAFIKALREARQSILDGLAKAKVKPSPEDPPATEKAEGEEKNDQEGDTMPETAPTEKNVVDSLIEKALQSVAKQWSHAPASYAPFNYGYRPAGSQNTNVAQTAKLDRIIEIIDQAILTENLDSVCRTLFVDILKSKGASSDKFSQIYSPLIARLRTFVSTRGLNLYSPPFVDLLQILIGTYLRDVLGKKDQISNPRLRKIGCGCRDCQELDRFILNPTSPKEVFRMAQSRRKHLERYLAAAPDLCSYHTIRYGSPQGIEVTKLPEVVKGSMWVHRQKEARTFLASIGNDEVIKMIMGGRYGDVVAAVNGAAPFGAARTIGDGSSSSNSLAVANNRAIVDSSGGSSAQGRSSGSKSVFGSTATPGSSAQVARSTQVASTRVPPAAVAGKKRKSNPIVNLGVVDLTDD